jgi:hypothetical protein
MKQTKKKTSLEPRVFTLSNVPFHTRFQLQNTESLRADPRLHARHSALYRVWTKNLIYYGRKKKKKKVNN